MTCSLFSKKSIPKLPHPPTDLREVVTVWRIRWKIIRTVTVLSKHQWLVLTSEIGIARLDLAFCVHVFSVLFCNYGPVCFLFIFSCYEFGLVVISKTRLQMKHCEPWAGQGTINITQLCQNAQQNVQFRTKITNCVQGGNTGSSHLFGVMPQTWLVPWLSGRMLVFDRRAFAGLRSTYSWQVTTYAGKSSAICQPTRQTQPFILSGSINEQ